MSDELEKQSPAGIIWASLALFALPAALTLTCWIGAYLNDAIAAAVWSRLLALLTSAYEETLPLLRLLKWYWTPWIP
jgi:hypothetical protein